MTWTYPAEPVGTAWLAAAALAKRLVLLPRSRRLVRVELVPAAAGAPAVVYLGEGESLHYLATLHGTAWPPAVPEAVSLAALPRLLRSRPSDQLWYVELSRTLAPLLPRGAWTTHPWVTQKVLLAGRPARPVSRALEGVYGRKIRQHGFVHRFVTDPAAVATFYRELYLPYVQWRFGDAGQPRSERELQRAVRAGFLLQVLDGDRWLAGVVCRRSRHEVAAVAFGLRSPYPELLRRGAQSASSYFLIRWAEAQHLRAVDLLRSRPHVCDGVYEHKRRLGAAPCWGEWPHTTIAILLPASGALPPSAAGLLVRVGVAAAVPLAQALGTAAPPERRYRRSCTATEPSRSDAES